MPATHTKSAHFCSLCPWWLGGLLNHSARRLLHNPKAILGGHVRPGQRVADVGAGSGFFTLPLAELVGESGRVYAVDLQQKMLQQIERHAARSHHHNLVTSQARPDFFGLPEQVDFILVFWMLHEVSNPARFVAALRTALAPGGTVLFAEPKLHVSQSCFLKETTLFTEAGFRVLGTPPIRGSRALLLGNAAPQAAPAELVT